MRCDEMGKNDGLWGLQTSKNSPGPFLIDPRLFFFVEHNLRPVAMVYIRLIVHVGGIKWPGTRKGIRLYTAPKIY